MSITTGPLAEKLNALRRLPSPAMRRRIRLRAHITQADLAEALGTTRETVARYEAGTRTPRGELLMRYVELLDALRRR